LAANLISNKIKPGKSTKFRPKFKSNSFQKPRKIEAIIPASKPVPDINKKTNSVTSASNDSQHDSRIKDSDDFSDEFDDDFVFDITTRIISTKPEDLPEKNELNDSNNSIDSDPPSPIIERTKKRISFSSDSENDASQEKINPSNGFSSTARGGQVKIDAITPIKSGASSSVQVKAQPKNVQSTTTPSRSIRPYAGSMNLKRKPDFLEQTAKLEEKKKGRIEAEKQCIRVAHLNSCPNFENFKIDEDDCMQTHQNELKKDLRIQSLLQSSNQKESIQEQN